MVSTGMPHIDEKRKERVDLFAKYVSVLPWFNIYVLHKYYINIFVPEQHAVETSQYRTRAITCADLLLSPMVHRINYNVFVFRSEIVDKLRSQIMQKEAVLKKAGNFMLTFNMECRKHFLGPKYMEVFRIEASMILDPKSEASRISKHIAAKLNRDMQAGRKVKGVDYFLNFLNRDDISEGQKELANFLEGMQGLNEQSELPDQLRILKNNSDGGNETITIKLPRKIKQQILGEINQQFPNVPKSTSTLYAVIVGIDIYNAEDIFPLDSAEKDANAIHEYLLNNRDEQVGFEADVIQGERATKNEVLESLFQAVQKCEAEDHLLFYFAGYGALEFYQKSQLFAQSNIEEENIAVEQAAIDSVNRKRSIVCYDTSAGDLALNFREILHLLNQLPPKSSFTLLLDCGFGRHRLLKLKDNPKVRSLAEPLPNRDESAYVFLGAGEEITEMQSRGAAFYASDEDDNAYEIKEHGYFTRGLIDALKNSGNDITCGDLLTGEKSLSFPSTRQTPLLQTLGDYQKSTKFLGGFLKQHSKSFLVEIERVKATKGESLNLADFHLDQIPPEVFALSNLKSLDISSNKIKEIPADILKLTLLESLVATKNPLSKVHENIGSLSNLKLLHFDECELKRFPKALLKLRGLNELSLRNNFIKFIPYSIRNFPALSNYDFRENEILNIPKGILEGSATEFSTYLDSLDPFENPESATPLVLAIGFDYDYQLKNITAEIKEMRDLFEPAKADLVDYFNPDALTFCNSLYQQRERLAIIHIAAYHLNEITDAKGRRVPMEPYEWADLFACIQEEEMSVGLIFFNCCDSDQFITHLTTGIFKTAIGLPGKVNDELAVQVMRDFYSDLIDGNTIQESFDKTRRLYAD